MIASPKRENGLRVERNLTSEIFGSNERLSYRIRVVIVSTRRVVDHVAPDARSASLKRAQREEIADPLLLVPLPPARTQSVEVLAGDAGSDLTCASRT